MNIGKIMKFESAHVVRNCSSERCKFSIHGHSYVVEIQIQSDKLDNGGMVADFGLLKVVKQFVDAFDHSYVMWDNETEEFKDFFKKNSDRLITMPVSPSAENFALMFHVYINKIISRTQFANGEHNPQLVSVKVNETVTGYAKTDKRDIKGMVGFFVEHPITFSDAIKKDFDKVDLFDGLLENDSFIFINQKPLQQCEIVSID